MQRGIVGDGERLIRAVEGQRLSDLAGDSGERAGAVVRAEAVVGGSFALEPADDVARGGEAARRAGGEGQGGRGGAVGECAAGVVEELGGERAAERREGQD